MIQHAVVRGLLLRSPSILSHLPRPVQVGLIDGLCQAIRRELAEHGPDARLMMLGTGLSYCGSLLRDAGPDAAAERADAARAQLEDELQVPFALLRATLHRPGDAAQRAAAQLLAALLRPPQIAAQAQVFLDLAVEPEGRRQLERLGCQPFVAPVRAALRELERAGGAVRPVDEIQGRARQAARFADGLLGRLLGHVAALLDLADEMQRERALRLLGPLLEVVLQPAATAA